MSRAAPLRAARAWAAARLGGSFFRPVLTLVSGAAVAQAVVFAARPVLTRLYTPDEFGVFTLFVTLAALGGPLATGRFDDALMLPAARRDAGGLLLLALGMAALTALVVAVLALWREGWAALLDTPALAPALLLLAPTLLALTWGQALEAWHTRFDRFRLVSAGRVAQSGTAAAFQVGAGLLGAGALGLVGGAAAGFGATLLVAGVALVLRDRAVVRAALRSAPMRALAARYRRFPLLSAPAAFLNLLSGRVPILLLAAFFGAATVGLFGLAFGMLATPVGLVTGAVGQVFFVRAAAAHREGALGPLTRQVHRRLVAAALFPMAAAALAGPELFAFVFGAAWREAGVHARLLAPWLFVSAVASPLTRVFDVTERQRADLGFSVVLFGAQAAALLAASGAGEARVAVAAVSTVGTATRLLQVAWLLRIAGVPLGRAALDLGRHLGLALAGLLPAAAALTLDAPPLVLLAAVVLGGLAYLALAARDDRREGKVGA
jgi:O-antigen/teichoic acid export membrane protein